VTVPPKYRLVPEKLRDHHSRATVERDRVKVRDPDGKPGISTESTGPGVELCAGW
jgi:hypothetical protein